MNYANLHALLTAQQWQAADDETARILLALAGREPDGWLDVASITKLSCDDLLAIDQAWRQSSDGRFGFSVQRDAWLDCGQQIDYATELRLGTRLGWFNQGWLFGDQLNFSLSAPIGHLPNLNQAKRGILLRWMGSAEVMHSAIAAKMAACSSTNRLETEQPSIQPDSTHQFIQDGTTLTIAVTPHQPLDSAQNYYQRGNARLSQAQYHEALAAYNQALQLLPQSPEILQAKAVALLRLNRLTEALQTCEESLQLKPDFVEAWHLKAGILVEQHKLEEAMSCCTESLRLQPDFAETWHLRAGILVKQEKFNEAIESCERALQINPNFLAADELKQQLQTIMHAKAGGLLDYEKGLSLLSSQQYAAAVDSFERVTHSMPTFDEAHYCKGLALGNLGRHEEALTAFEAALRLNPTFDEVHRNRDSALYNLGRLEEALASYNELLKSRPDYAYGYYCRGLLLDQLGHYEAALESLNQSIQLDSNSAPTHLSKGIVLDRLGRPVEAFQALNESLRLNPSSPQTQNSLRIIMQKLKGTT